jgi:SOS-response transcriptional repressor LexA
MPAGDLIPIRARERLGDRVGRRRRELGLTQTELARRAGINQGYLSEIERNRRHPSPVMLAALASALDLPEGVLLGGGSEHDNPQPLETRTLPLLGHIPAGPPAESQEILQDFPILRHQWSPHHYCLKLTFDSMEPTLKPGDIVLVHYRPDVDPSLVQGPICACLVDGESTLKRVSVEQRGGARLVVLRGDNPAVQPLVIDSTRDFSIQGVVTALVSRNL